MIRARHVPGILFLAAVLFASAAGAQWKYDITLTGYPQARWKALTSYVDKPTMADINGDGRPEIIAAGVFGDVYCVDGRTGQILWTYGDEHSLELAVYICPAIADINCDKVDDIISVTPLGKVIALDGRTGRKLWSFQAEEAIVFSPSAFDLDRNGMVEISVSDMKGNLYLLSSSGKLLWKVSSEAPFYGSPALGLIGNRPVVIAGDSSGTLRCYDGSNGNPLWRYPASSGAISTSAVLFKDPQNGANPWRVLVGSQKGEVHVVNAENGHPIWSRLMTKGVVGEFAIGDLTGSGTLDLVFSTSDSEVVVASLADGKARWTKKFRVPVREYLNVKDGKRLGRETLGGQPVLFDGDGDGKQDVILETRGLNSYIYCLGGTDGRMIWNYGNRNLNDNPPVSESVIIAAALEELQSDQPYFLNKVPVYSNPTPIVGDFDGDGRADLIVNDRDEVGLIHVPLSSRAGSGSWHKYASSSCNNMILFSAPCVGTAPAPSLRLSAERREIVAGENVRLCWTSSNAVDVEIDQGIGVVGAENCITVTPTRDTTWTATARGCGGEARDSISVIVRVKPPPPPPAPAVPPSPPRLTEAEREAVTRSIKDVFFEYDYYRLTPEAQKTLDENIQQLKSYEAARIALEATCDERGSKIYNHYLALARGESVREYLATRGIDASRIELLPQGETTRWDSRRNEEAWAKNRRVHFVILP